MGAEPSRFDAQQAKNCCADLYASDWARLLLGPSFHPGGVALTERLGRMLGLAATARVLDVACGRGTSALYLAEHVGCHVTGIDVGAANVAAARVAAETAGLAERTHFVVGDAEGLPIPAASVDAVICECAFCTFPNKHAAAAEFTRVLRPGGRVGLSDLTRSGPLPRELEGLLAWVACIADARPVEEYVTYLREAGFIVDAVETHDDALARLVQDVRIRLLGADVLVKLKKVDLPGATLDEATALARAAAQAVRDGTLGYMALAATWPRA